MDHARHLLRHETELERHQKPIFCCFFDPDHSKHTPRMWDCIIYRAYYARQFHHDNSMTIFFKLSALSFINIYFCFCFI